MMPGNADGSIIVDTEVDTKGFTAGSDEMKAAVKSLSKSVKDMQSQLQKIGEKKIPTEEYTQVQEDIAQAEKHLDRYRQKLTTLSEKGKVNTEEWRSLTAEIEATQKELARVKQLKAEMEAEGTAYISGTDTEQYQRVSSALQYTKQKLAEMQAELDRTNSKWAQMPTLSGYIKSAVSGIGTAVKSAFGTLHTAVTHPLQTADRVMGSLLQKSAQFVSNAARFTGSKLVTGLKQALSATRSLIASNNAYRNSFGGVLARIKQIGPALLMARGVMGMLRKAVNAYMQANQELSNTLSSCWTGIGNLLGPIIERLINLLATAVAYFTAFLKLLGFAGKSASKVIGGAGGKAKEETDKLKRALASFDDLNILSDNSSDEGGGGGGANTGALPEVQMPDWAKLMTEQIQSGQWAEAAKTLATAFNDMVQSIDWAGMGTKAAEGVDGILTFLANAILGFDWHGLGSSLGTFINNLIYGVDWGNLGVVLGAKFLILIEGLGGLFATLDWNALGKALADGFMGLWNAIDWVRAGTMLSDGIKGVLNAISSAIKNTDWKKLGNDVADFIAAIDWSGVTSSLFNGIGAALGGLTAFLWGLIEDAWNSIVAWWNDVAYEGGEFTMEGLLNGLWAGICNIGQWLMDHIVTPFIDGFCDAFGIHSPSTVMAEFGENIIEGLLNGLTSTWDSIVSFFGDALSSIGSSIRDWATNAANTVSTWASNTKSTVTTWASNVKNSVTTWATNTKSSISNWVSSTKSSISTWGSNVYSTISSKVSSFKSTIASGFEAAKSSITSKMTSALDTIKNQGWSGVGDAICTGIGNGISNGWSWLKNKVSNVATGLLDAAKSALGIHSPSRLFRDVIGLNIGYGVGEGIEASQNSVLGSVTSVANAIADEFAAGEYSIGKILPANGLHGALGLFSGEVSNSFEHLLERLQAIAETVTFRMPAITNSAVPYYVSAKVSGSDDGLCDALTTSNDALAVAITRAIFEASREAARNVVAAIQEGGYGYDDDINRRTTEIINEINRRTRVMGQSPIL